jgi:hypothetical protein
MRTTYACLVLAIGCGSNTGSNGADASTDGAMHITDAAGAAFDAPALPTGRYEPWHVGAVWSYKLTDPMGVIAPAMDKKTTILAWENMPATTGPQHVGQPAYKVHLEQLIGSADAWEGFENDLDVRYAQIDYDTNGAIVDTQYEAPHRLKLDESAAHIATNAAFAETFNETTTTSAGTVTNPKVENWQVVNPAESVTVIAGTYTALHVRRTNSQGTTPKAKDYWFVRDVGKVKETGGSQDEELMSYTP